MEISGAELKMPLNIPTPIQTPMTHKVINKMINAIKTVLVPGEDLLRLPMYKVDKLIRIIEGKR